jgi:hypothetical protein
MYRCIEISKSWSETLEHTAGHVDECGLLAEDHAEEAEL